MREFPKGGIIGKTVHAIREIKALQIPLHAAYTGFFIVLSIFPALLLILSILRYTPLTVESLVELIAAFVPGALMDMVEELVYSTYLNASGAVVGISALTALWSASRGIYGLVAGFNAIYGVPESRTTLRNRCISVVYTFAFFLVMVLTLALHVFGSALINMLRMVDHALLIFLVDLIDLRFFLLLILQTLVFALMFMVLPGKRNRFRSSLPGALLASMGWLVFSDLFSIYVENFDRYGNIYGSIYAVALGMLWLYCCLSILFLGAALNRYWMENVEKL